MMRLQVHFLEFRSEERECVKNLIAGVISYEEKNTGSVDQEDYRNKVCMGTRATSVARGIYGLLLSFSHSS